MLTAQYDEFIAPLLGAVGELVDQGASSGEFRDGAAARIPEVVTSSALHIAVMRLMFSDRKPIDGASFIEAHVDLAPDGLLIPDGHPPNGAVSREGGL